MVRREHNRHAVRLQRVNLLCGHIRRLNAMHMRHVVCAPVGAPVHGYIGLHAGGTQAVALCQQCASLRAGIDGRVRVANEQHPHGGAGCGRVLAARCQRVACCRAPAVQRRNARAELRGSGLRRKVRRHVLARQCTALCAGFRIFKQRAHGACQLGGVRLGPAQPLVHCQPLAFGARCVGNGQQFIIQQVAVIRQHKRRVAAPARGYRWQPHRHGFHQRHAPRIAAGGQNKCVG